MLKQMVPGLPFREPGYEAIYCHGICQLAY